MQNTRGHLDVCEEAARRGGCILLEMQAHISGREKSPKDLVTEADLASQNAIREVLMHKFPDYGFVGEEDSPTGSGASQSPSPRGYRWIVDPLDGTVNYVHGLQAFCVAIALEYRGEPVVGVIYDPVHDECYTARAGGGAYCNGRPIRVSHCRRLREALVAASFSAGVSRESREIRQFVDVLVESQSVRRLGSAALTMCFVAAGQLDGYWTSSAKNWDVAAGVLLVREAGGVVTSVDGSPFQLAVPLLASASTEELHAELVATLARTAST